MVCLINGRCLRISVICRFLPFTRGGGNRKFYTLSEYSSFRYLLDVSSFTHVWVVRVSVRVFRCPFSFLSRSLSKTPPSLNPMSKEDILQVSDRFSSDSYKDQNGISFSFRIPFPFMRLCSIRTHPSSCVQMYLHDKKYTLH